MDLIGYLNKYFTNGEQGIFEDKPVDLTSHFIEKFGVDVKKEDNLYQFKYNMITVNWSFPITHECRGVILRYNGTWDYVSRPYNKFFNYHEPLCAIREKDFAPNLQIIEKADGCCHEDTVIITEDGEKTIKDICDNEYRGKILCFDTLYKKIEYRPVIAHSVKPNINNWYEVMLSDGKNIKLTGNHRVWLPKLNCYRKVEDLSEGDEVMIF